MAASMPETRIALRGSQGLWIVKGPPEEGEDGRFPKCGSGALRAMTFSTDGTLLGYCDGRRVVVVTTDNYREICQVPKPRTASLVISPQNNILATWEPYAVTKDQPAGTPNQNMWDIKTGELLKGFVQKKQQGWCPQWSADEAICARNVNNELLFFESNQFERYTQKLHLQKVIDFKIPEKCLSPYHVAAYVPGARGQPSFVRLYRYPNFGGHQAALANKSFYKADRVEITWNRKGTAVVVLTTTDTSAESYYGDQGLHFVSITGDSSLVPRSKPGPVYSVEWNPNSTSFVVVYGSMPAKATLFDLKCEPIFDFGTGPRNISYFNPQGNILCLAGFGALRGNMEFWGLTKQNLISNPKAPDTTYFEWSPDGEHILTATTSPRLRVSNGYKIWHFTGRLLSEFKVPNGEELWEVAWKSCATGIFPAPTVYVPGGKVHTLNDNKPKAYVPPALRDNPQMVTSPKYREDYELPSNAKKTIGESEKLSKSALKNKKRKEAKQMRKEQESSVDKQPISSETPAAKTDHVKTGDPEKDKKIGNIRKKLYQIAKLKEQQSAGKVLEINQTEKIKTEDMLLKELRNLELT